MDVTFGGQHADCERARNLSVVRPAAITQVLHAPAASALGIGYRVCLVGSDFRSMFKSHGIGGIVVRSWSAVDIHGPVYLFAGLHGSNPRNRRWQGGHTAKDLGHPGEGRTTRCPDVQRANEFEECNHMEGGRRRPGNGRVGNSGVGAMWRTRWIARLERSRELVASPRSEAVAPISRGNRYQRLDGLHRRFGLEADVLRRALHDGNEIRYGLGLDLMREEVLVASDLSHALFVEECLTEGNRILAAYGVEDRVVNLVGAYEFFQAVTTSRA